LARNLQLAHTGSLSECKKIMNNSELFANLDMIQMAMEDLDVNALNEMSYMLETFSFETKEITSHINEILESIMFLEQDRCLKHIEELRELIK